MTIIIGKGYNILFGVSFTLLITRTEKKTYQANTSNDKPKIFVIYSF